MAAYSLAYLAYGIMHSSILSCSLIRLQTWMNRVRGRDMRDRTNQELENSKTVSFSLMRQQGPSTRLSEQLLETVDMEETRFKQLLGRLRRWAGCL